MCPGGRIVAATTAEGEMTVNGMSSWARGSGWANAGIVASVDPGDDPAAAVEQQRSLEARAWRLGGGSAVAPAQPLQDFLAARAPRGEVVCSYLPGVQAAPVHRVFPSELHERLIGGFGEFERAFRGFCGREAVVLAAESRTSSPVRIPRDPESLMHPAVSGLFPAGEGAGHAGGILSSALDGRRAALAVGRYLGRDGELTKPQESV
jgi:uncharacterized FAD-dependent dehydrogenase